jgi:hypothetical protein
VAASVTDTAKRKLIKQRVAYWQERLLLQLWTIVRISFHTKRKKENPSTMAETLVTAQYRKIHTRFYLPAVDVNEIDYTIVHEFVHAILGDYDNYIESECEKPDCLTHLRISEQTTEHLTRIILEGGKK